MNVGDAVVVVRYVGEDFSRRGVIQDIGAIFIDVLFEGETLGCPFYESELRPLDALTQLAEQAE